MFRFKTPKPPIEKPEIYASGIVHRTYVRGVTLDKDGMEAAQLAAASALGKTTNDIVWTDFVILKNGLDSEQCVLVEVLINHG